MDTKLLCRAKREATGSWLSLVLPDNLSSKEEKAGWIEDMCGGQFAPKAITNVPEDLVDEILELLPIRKGEDDG